MRGIGDSCVTNAIVPVLIHMDVRHVGVFVRGCRFKGRKADHENVIYDGGLDIRTGLTGVRYRACPRKYLQETQRRESPGQYVISKNDVAMYGQVDVVSPDESDKIAHTLIRVLPSGFHKFILRQSWTYLTRYMPGWQEYNI